MTDQCVFRQTLLGEAREEITALEYISYHGPGVDDDHGLWYADLVADDISKIHSLIIALSDRIEDLERAIKYELGITHGDDTIRRLRVALQGSMPAMERTQT